MLLSLTLLACLPAPDTSSLDSGAGSDSGSTGEVSVSGNVIWTGLEAPRGGEMLVAVHHFPIGDDYDTGELLSLSDPTEMPSDSAPARYSLSLPEEPEGEYLQTFDADLLGAVFLVSAWEDEGDGQLDGNERIMGTGSTVLFYLRGQLTEEYSGVGFQEGWNRVDFDYWVSGNATSVAAIEGSTSALNVETNLLPDMPSALSGEIEGSSSAGALTVALVDYVGTCESQAAGEDLRRYKALTVTKAQGDEFTYSAFPADIDVADWDSTVLLYGCVDPPEGRPVDGAMFELVSFVDEDENGAWDPGVDSPQGRSTSGDAASVLIFFEPRAPGAYFYVNQGASMGWNRVSATEGSDFETLPWDGAIIYNF